jgi:hypothetical protein
MRSSLAKAKSSVENSMTRIARINPNYFNAKTPRRKVAERQRKLASYEVAGVGGQNEFVPRGTME